MHALWQNIFPQHVNVGLSHLMFATHLVTIFNSLPLHFESVTRVLLICYIYRACLGRWRRGICLSTSAGDLWHSHLVLLLYVNVEHSVMLQNDGVWYAISH
jgi:hypothetical protein